MPNRMKCYTYYYLSFGNDIAFYVGKTTGELKLRLSVHRTEAKCGSFNLEKDKMILDNWDSLQINELETIKCHAKKSRKYEIYWIQQMQVWGFSICNRDGALKKRRELKPIIPKKQILIDEEAYIEFNKFCQKRGMIMCRVAQIAIKEKMATIKDKEKKLRIA